MSSWRNRQKKTIGSIRFGTRSSVPYRQKSAEQSNNVRPTSPWIGNDLLKDLHSAFAMYASVRAFAHVHEDEYRTKAAEFQARALCESNEMTRLHFDNLAKDYLQLAELAAQIDNLRAAQDRRFR